mgnify:CR=1 FL=1
MKIKMNGQVFTHQELGLKEVFYKGKKYVDITPFYIDSKESVRIKKYMDEQSYGGRMNE